MNQHITILNKISKHLRQKIEEQGATPFCLGWLKRTLGDVERKFPINDDRKQYLRRAIAEEDAIDRGYEALTLPYADGEQWMLLNTIGDMVKDKIDFAVVSTPQGYSIWRKGMTTVEEFEKKMLEQL